MQLKHSEKYIKHEEELSDNESNVDTDEDVSMLEITSECHQNDVTTNNTHDDSDEYMSTEEYFQTEIKETEELDNEKKSSFGSISVDGEHAEKDKNDNNLKLHFICSLCDDKFTDPSERIRHMKERHPLANVCNHCSLQFNNTENCSQHMIHCSEAKFIIGFKLQLKDQGEDEKTTKNDVSFISLKISNQYFNHLNFINRKRNQQI